MSKRLAELLGKSEALVAEAIEKLEAAAGLPAEDVKLLAENRQLIRRKLSQLGLDPNDTHAAELYHALRVRYAMDADRLDKALGIQDDGDVNERIRKAASLLAETRDGQELWVLKPSTIRNLLRQQPPRQLMKRLGYRSVDSLLKREAVEGIMLLAKLTESPSWQKQYLRMVSKADTSNYVMQPYKIVLLDHSKFGDLQSEAPVIVDPSSGTIAISPGNASGHEHLLSLVMQLLQGLKELGLKVDVAKILAIHPALAWWQDTQHLIYQHDGETVSFNIRDAALNYSQNADFENRQQLHAQVSLWQELAQRYRQYSESIGQLAQELEAKLGYNNQTETAISPLQAVAETVEA